MVTFLWSTSWVLIKFGLQNIPALTFAGLRYTLAFLCLAPFAIWEHRRTRPQAATNPPREPLRLADWLRLIALGIVFYTVTQGAQFLALAYLPAITTSLLLNLTTIVIALSGVVLSQLGAERPALVQWAGIVLNLAGVLLYFYPIDIPAAQIFGIAVAVTGVLANAGSSILGRSVNRWGRLSPLQVTAITMGIGGLLLLAIGLATQGLPRLTPAGWATIGWLAVVNTAFAFTLWNKTLRVLSAVESSIINSTMLVQIAILAWIFLGERATTQELIGMALAALGVAMVQWRR